ncbi:MULTISPECIES: PHP domain-containing protein [Micrococcaceae]|uniref:PHP domain-containing protein n=1 Tax=unclassified Kocuria TaxID=2649579 RepID=UPI0010118D0D|nr:MULTISPECIES: PHP domain-containing protein [unclassified Kocuria]
MCIDLHTHSNISDGTETPAQVVEQAARAGLTAVALTDHDSTVGWEPAAQAASRCGIEFVPGMEVSCASDDGVSVHLLSYLHDPQAPGLRSEIEKSRAARLTRAQKMVERLSEDFPINWQDVEDQVGKDATVGRPHIADALVAKGVCKDRSEAFGTILTTRTKYYVPHYAPNPALAVALVREAGGVPVFAHPLASSRGRVVGPEVFEEMVAAGLAGLEVYHRDNSEDDRKWLLDFARNHDLIVTGSSDYHGAGKPNRLGENTTTRQSLEEIQAQSRGVCL